MITIYRYEVPVDDQWHEYQLNGPIVHVAARRIDTVEFWARVNGDMATMPRRLRVFGTGQEIPDEAGRHVGTALAGSLVWHLLEHAGDREPPWWRRTASEREAWRREQYDR